MNVSAKKDDLSKFVFKQLNNFIPDTTNNFIQDIKKLMPLTLERLEYCFNYIALSPFKDSQNNTKFDYLHSDQYCMFIYILSNEAYNNGFKELYIKLSVLNRILNGIDLFGHVQMPDIFLLVHPIGTIIGRAKFENYLCIYQGVTVGGSHKNNKINYPNFGRKINLFAHTKIIGNCLIGENVTFGANTFIINQNINDNSVVTGTFPDCSIKVKQQQWTPFIIRG